jgi:2-methylcitrate dehydratase PrpD
MLLELSRILESIEYDDLPEVTVDKAKVTILNFLATGLAAADSPIVSAESSVWKTVGGVGNSVILGHSGKVSPLAAASVNALMGQIYLLEDCHEHTLSHPGVVAIPVALALGQDVDASGRKVIEAVVAGYESIGRIGSVLIAPGFPGFGSRPASTLAPFGGTAAAAAVLGLDAKGFCDALSIAGNTASGVMEFVNSGAEDICLQNCFAAKNSIMAAMLAAQGAGGSATILDGWFGLGRAMNRKDLDWGPALKDTPGHYMIDESFIKRYPGCGHVLSTAQAAASLVAKHKIAPDDIESVTAGVSKGATEFPGVDNQGPFSGTISAMMSHQFMIASILVHGDVSARTVDMYDHPEVAKMAKKISVELDEEVDRAFPQKTGAKLYVRLTSGGELYDFQEDLDPLGRAEVIERFRLSAANYFSDKRAEEIIDKTLSIEKLGSVTTLMDLLEK